MIEPSALVPLMTFPREDVLRRRFELAILHERAGNVGEFVNALDAEDRAVLFNIGLTELRSRVAIAQQEAIDGSLPLCIVWRDPSISMREACDRAAAVMRQQSVLSCRKTVSKAPRPRAWTERHYRALRRKYASVLHYWMAAYPIAGEAPSYDELTAAICSPLFNKLLMSTQEFVAGPLSDNSRTDAVTRL